MPKKLSVLNVVEMLKDEIALHEEMAFANDNPEYQHFADRLKEFVALVEFKLEQGVA